MEIQTYLLIMTIVPPVLSAICGYQMAKMKHRKCWLWAINCFFIGLLGLLTVSCSASADYDEEIEAEGSDTLGWVTFIFCMILVGLGICFGYYQMVWELTMQVIN